MSVTPGLHNSHSTTHFFSSHPPSPHWGPQENICYQRKKTLRKHREGFAGGYDPIQVPQVTMAMKTKKERFHVGAVNKDLEGEMSREKGWGGGVCCSKTYSSTLQAIRWVARCTEGENAQHTFGKVTTVSGNHKKKKRWDSQFWSPARVCFGPAPFPRRPGLRMWQTRTPWEWSETTSFKLQSTPWPRREHAGVPSSDWTMGCTRPPSYSTQLYL